MTGSTLGHGDEAAWLEWRRAGVTATDVADAANGTHGGLYGVVARKLGLVTVKQTAQMDRGHRWQPTIADTVHVLTGLWVVGEESWCEHATHGWMRATVDGFLAPSPEATLDQVTAVLEVKTRGVGTRPSRDRWTDQVQWQMLVTGVNRAVIAEAVIDDVDDTAKSVTLTDVDADPDRQAFLAAVADDIRGHVTAGTLPTPDTADSLPIVKAVHAAASSAASGGEPVDLTGVESQLAAYAALGAQLKALHEQRDVLEAQIREALGDATRGTAAGWTVSLSHPTRTVPGDAADRFVAEHPEWGRLVLDTARLKAEAPDVWESLRAPVGARRLTVKQAEEQT